MGMKRVSVRLLLPSPIWDTSFGRATLACILRWPPSLPRSSRRRNVGASRAYPPALGDAKSTLMQCLYFDQDPTEGDMRVAPYDGGAENCFELSRQQKRRIRDTIFGMVYQNPYLGLRMSFSALSNIAEKQIAAGCRNVGQMVGRGEELLERVNIPLRRAQDAPRDFSGGMQQRVQIAKALSNEPPMLFLDEVTTGLDLSVQARVLDLILSLRRDLGVSMVVVSHDLGVIRLLADRTIVMLDGSVIEHGLTDQIMQDPQHAYTQELVYSLL